MKPQVFCSNFISRSNRTRASKDLEFPRKQEEASKNIWRRAATKRELEMKRQKEREREIVYKSRGWPLHWSHETSKAKERVGPRTGQRISQRHTWIWMPYVWPWKDSKTELKWTRSRLPFKGPATNMLASSEVTECRGQTLITRHILGLLATKIK